MKWTYVAVPDETVFVIVTVVVGMLLVEVPAVTPRHEQRLDMVAVGFPFRPLGVVLKVRVEVVFVETVL